MWYRNAEDRLNPVTPEGVNDTTLGGYPAVHGRAPAFEGVDGAPYTVAIEAEPEGEAGESWVGYLVFVRWSDTGTAVMGHLDSEDLAWGTSETEARSRLEELPLARVQRILDETIVRKQQSGSA